MSGSPASPFQIAIRVAPDDIDAQGHVNNIVYLRWVQDVATAHWRAMTSEEEQSAVIWVVMRHEIDYKAPALLGDELLAHTWVGVASGLTFERHAEIVRARDGLQLAKARTLWCPINPQSGRPQRITADLRARFSSTTDKHR
jgi:acyl-CoA thioester hydrolase